MRMTDRHRSRVRDAGAGGVAAAVWALQEPVDRRVFRCDYSDVAILGKAVTGGRRWWLAGSALHVANGVLFGLAFHEVRRRRALDPRVLAVAMALGEHLALYPLGGLVDRFHPRRGAPGIPPLLANGRAFAQATWRHALFGVVLGALGGQRGSETGRVMRITESILIEAPPRDVWAVLTDLDSHPRWRPALREFRQISAGPLRVGARIREVIEWRGRELELEDEVMALEEERRFAICGGWRAAAFALDVLLEPRSAATSVTFDWTMRPRSLLMRVVTPVLGGTMRRETLKELEGLRAHVEGQFPA